MIVEGGVCDKGRKNGAGREVCGRKVAVETNIFWYTLHKQHGAISYAADYEHGKTRRLTLTIPVKPIALATAAVRKYAAEIPPRRLRLLTVHGSKDPSHSLSESHFRERQRART